ncbi:hypothetical protein SLEP1_g17141 [Rubroshorea leprosula]|uniref:Uncharacterized protein n=1 Tax=Rubroshorea leprosula TaxID=152421 RepID=A0AAV5J2E0_9ROSI|nr:hypothetical protein SLEP1_g17141 [Rubroshorea leprosula]
MANNHKDTTVRFTLRGLGTHHYPNKPITISISTLPNGHFRGGDNFTPQHK